MRLLILAIALVACSAAKDMTTTQQNAAAPTVQQKAADDDAASAASGAPAAKPGELVAKAAPRNFVCERFAYVNKNAQCFPEYSDAGDRHTHSARVVIDQQMIACIINDVTPSVVCTDLITVPAPAPQPEPPPPPSSAKAPAQGKK